MTKAFAAIMQNSLGFRLIPISIRELLYLEESPCSIYGISDGLYTKLLNTKEAFSKDLFRDLISKGHTQLFVSHQNRNLIISKIQENLTKVTRSLSIGDPFENCKKQINFLTIHMEYLYMDPTNDELLTLQNQSVKNLFLFLIQHLGLHEKIFYHFLKQKHHFIFAQPFISSLLLCGILSSTKLFPQKEMEFLFITSYFKDIGMSAIPTENYDKKILSDSEKKILANHAENSAQILEGRIPLSSDSLNIIRNHHAFSLLTKNTGHGVENKKQGQDLLINREIDESFMIGTKTIFICTLDIISAMITPRPWREAEKLFDTLGLVRTLISDSFPQEFKSIVTYFKNFKKK